MNYIELHYDHYNCQVKNVYWVYYSCNWYYLPRESRVHLQSGYLTRCHNLIFVLFGLRSGCSMIVSNVLFVLSALAQGGNILADVYHCQVNQLFHGYTGSYLRLKKLQHCAEAWWECGIIKSVQWWFALNGKTSKSQQGNKVCSIERWPGTWILGMIRLDCSCHLASNLIMINDSKVQSPY